MNILGVVYVHQKSCDGGDIYLTRFGYKLRKHLQIGNWYERDWYENHRIPLEGTSSVYKVSTKEVDGKSYDLVVKNSRVGEDVPLQTKTLIDLITEFNSPWEEFSLVMELREGKFGPHEVSVHTQKPLAIYVPPEQMQTWQSGRSKDKINRIIARHPGLEIEMLKQYKLIYGWIHGKDIVELFSSACIDLGSENWYLKEGTRKVIGDLKTKGFVIADMKPEHVIIGDDEIRTVLDAKNNGISFSDSVYKLLLKGRYSVVDYELLTRTPEHENQISATRRQTYHKSQMSRFSASEIPGHLRAIEIFGLPYLYGQVESTGGRLWVVGKNAVLFDYFLPERWRKTHAWRLSAQNDIYYTITKDHIHIVWKISKVGENPEFDPSNPLSPQIISYGFNSPFEEFAIAHQLNLYGIPTVYIRAIYMTGSAKIEDSPDTRRFTTHSSLLRPDGKPILCQDHNYITIRGFYNGPDDWIAQKHCFLCRPLDLQHALLQGYIDSTTSSMLKERILKRMIDAGFDGSFLKDNDYLTVINPDGKLVTGDDGYPEIRLCNFDLIRIV